MKQFGSRLSYKMEITLYIVWGLIAILWTITAFQVQATLLSLGLLIIQTPPLSPYGWNTSTLHGLNRLFVLIIAALWLGAIMFSGSVTHWGGLAVGFFQANQSPAHDRHLA